MRVRSLIQFMFFGNAYRYGVIAAGVAEAERVRLVADAARVGPEGVVDAAGRSRPLVIVVLVRGRVIWVGKEIKC